MTAAEEIARIAEACVVRAGDVLVLSIDRDLPRREFEEFADHVRTSMPETVKVLVVAGSIHLHVLRSGEVDQ